MLHNQHVTYVNVSHIERLIYVNALQNCVEELQLGVGEHMMELAVGAEFDSLLFAINIPEADNKVVALYAVWLITMPRIATARL